MIQHISVVTFAVRDMVRSDFYKKLGFEVLYGGESAAFSSLRAGQAFVNLVASGGTTTDGGAEPFSELITWTSTTGHCRHKD